MREFDAGSYDVAIIGAGHAGIEAALAAARYIVAGEAKKLFSFSLTPEACKQLDQVTEAFLMTQQERGFRTLDYYKQLRRQSFS